LIPKTLLPKFVNPKILLAGLLTRLTFVAFPNPPNGEKSGASNKYFTDLQLRAQSRFHTGFPLSETIRNQQRQRYMINWDLKDAGREKVMVAYIGWCKLQKRISESVHVRED
jgi:hypothetical protein